MSETAGRIAERGGKQKKAAGPMRTMRVVRCSDVTANMRRIVLEFDDGEGVSYEPGQALVFAVPLKEGGTGRRDYTIREYEPETGEVSVDFFLHGSAPGADWARTARPGDTIEARGPRGKTILSAAADWHLFVGDETCIPAILHMLERLPRAARAIAFVELGDPDDRQDVRTGADLDLRFVHRRDGDEDMTIVREVEALTLPEGQGQAYVIGQTAKVQQIRRGLIARGLDKSSISAEGYWRPGRKGGHDHIRDE